MSRIEAAFAGPGGAPALIALSAPEPCWTRDAPAHALSADPTPALLDAIYDAALAPERWPDLLGALVACLGGIAAALHCGPAAGPFRITAASGLGEAALRGYGERYGAIDPIAGAAAAWAAPATAREAAGAGLERTEFFAGWMRPNGFDDALCLELLPPGAAHGASLRIVRPPRAPRFGPTEAAVLARLAPHLRRAAGLSRRLPSSPSRPVPAEQLAGALDRLAAGVALLDSGGALLWANRTAEPLLRGGHGLSLDRNGVLRAAVPGAAEALRRLIGAAVAGQEGAMPVPRADGRAPLALHAAPLPARERAFPEAPRRQGVLLLLSDPEREAAPDAALRGRLRAIYGLTAAEATVAARAAGGAGLPEVARSLGLAVATARTHAQRVFSKAGVRGQAELARQVERLSLLRAPER